MAELKNIRIAVSGIYDYAFEELPSLRVPFPGQGAPEWAEQKRVYKIYRPASVLAAACDKFKLLPLTHHHPSAPVDGQNFRELAIGYTGENPWLDYLDGRDEVGIRSNVLLYDDEALNAYERGEIQLSPGYIASFEWQNGTSPHGEKYDIVMREITEVNHLAILPAGRGGADAVVMDSARRTYKPGEISETTGLQKKNDGSWGSPDNQQLTEAVKKSTFEEKPLKNGDTFFELDSDILDINGQIHKDTGPKIDQIYFSEKYAEDPTDENTISPEVKGKGLATLGVLKAVEYFKSKGFKTFEVDTMSEHSAKLMKRLEKLGAVKPLSDWRFEGDTVRYAISDKQVSDTKRRTIFDRVNGSVFDLFN